MGSSVAGMSPAYCTHTHTHRAVMSVDLNLLYLALPYAAPESFQAGGQGLHGADPQPKTLCLCTWRLKVQGHKASVLDIKVLFP